MSKPLDGKVVAITGAGHGIGEAIALRLAADGAAVAVAVIDRDVASATRVADLITGRHGRKSVALEADVASRDDVHRAIAGAERALDGLDIVVNNAGIAQVLPLLEVAEDDFRGITDINVGGVLWGIQAAARSFIDRGVRGKIINACSISGYKGQAVFGVYSATKFAVRALTQAAAQEYAPYGITVNGYSPGTVGTSMWEAIDRKLAERTGAEIGESFQRQASEIALGRPSTPEDVAGFVSFLAGPDSDYMTGQSPLVDGGTLFV